MTAGPGAEALPELGDDRFKLLARCGSGGAADVFRAEEISLTKPVAVKVLRDTAAEVWSRFDDECKTMGSLSGCGTVVVPFSHGRTVDGRPFLAMEFFEHGSLERKLNLGDAMSGAQIVNIVADIADALDNAHAAGIFHLDVKPANIFPGAGRNPTKLADFGISVRADDARRVGARTELTIEHASPELLDGRVPGRAADVYALASTAYQMFERHAPFPRRNDDSITSWIDRIRLEPMSPLIGREASPSIDSVIRRSLDKDPTRRHPTAGQFAVELAAAVAQGVAPDTAPTLGPRPTRPSGHSFRAGPNPRPVEFEAASPTQPSATQRTRQVDPTSFQVPPIQPPPPTPPSWEPPGSWQAPGSSEAPGPTTRAPDESQVTRVVSRQSVEGPPPVVPTTERPSKWTRRRVASISVLALAGLMTALFGASVVRKVWFDDPPTATTSTTTPVAPVPAPTGAGVSVTTAIAGDPGTVVTKRSETEFVVHWSDTSGGTEPWLVVPVSDTGAAVGGVNVTQVPAGSAAPDGSVEVTVEVVGTSGCFRVVMTKDAQVAGAPTTCASG